MADWLDSNFIRGPRMPLLLSGSGPAAALCLSRVCVLHFEFQGFVRPNARFRLCTIVSRQQCTSPQSMLATIPCARLVKSWNWGMVFQPPCSPRSLDSVVTIDQYNSSIGENGEAFAVRNAALLHFPFSDRIHVDLTHSWETGTALGPLLPVGHLAPNHCGCHSPWERICTALR
ncbi:hypothetical protein M011DRAFT_174001 [Sporormia fimetaria CBS 119925]|uniref:Uncharacterized protein n=1 Tax=Sporormia fimetaria CBS 119925 TaxID=1340428 RepID=A0A6A6VLE3_9PLEO|nr:hypothetical protein M011DRAFT_174001 [Sporormia fimetaria CBS 119925]